MQGSYVWNRWRKQQSWNVQQIDLNNVKLNNVDLSNAYLMNTSLIEANLSHANLFGANLSHAMLNHADLRSADLRYANLSHANLRDAILSDAALRSVDLSNADLSDADLRDVNLSGANLRSANLRGARVGLTIFSHMDLRNVNGLAEIDHLASSQIDLHTVQLPQDGSVLHFLRGCGVPDEWIDYYRATMMHPIQYYSCFISYSSHDDTFAHRIHADLQAHGVRCWFAPEDMKIGNKLRPSIDEAIHLQDKLLLILSEHSLASSWVEVEVEAALEKEQRQGREVLFPVCIDESVMQTSQAWAKQLRRSRHIGDFTHWTDPQAYSQTFDRLLRDLKAEVKRENNG